MTDQSKGFLSRRGFLGTAGIAAAGGLAGCSSALKQASTSTPGAGAWYLVIVGGLAVAATLISSRGLWGFAADRYGWSLLPVGYRVRQPRG